MCTTTVAVASLLVGSESPGRAAVRVALLASVPLCVVATVRVRVAFAPSARSPTVQVPVDGS